MSSNTTLVAILMGSDSDIPKMKPCFEVLKELGIGYEARILSAHRTPEETAEFIRNSEKNGVQVFIGAAGAAAHLPGVIASFTTLPVIGIPLDGTPLRGVDSLYAIVQMPSGVPVATVAVDGSKNAGILAAQMLSLGKPELKETLKNFRDAMRKKVLSKTVE